MINFYLFKNLTEDQISFLWLIKIHHYSVQQNSKSAFESSFENYTALP